MRCGMQHKVRRVLFLAIDQNSQAVLPRVVLARAEFGKCMGF